MAFDDCYIIFFSFNIFVSLKSQENLFCMFFFGTVSECTFCNCKDGCFFSLVAAPWLEPMAAQKGSA